ncbi:hypothetical protein, partial [Actinacidiphila sp. bgisy160]|uniref:hypothetical protein n=1 Tax=Actinacidiphila sp. bgisy160 TaxID=3413796 RepID=UPI003D719DC1
MIDSVKMRCETAMVTPTRRRRGYRSGGIAQSREASTIKGATNGRPDITDLKIGSECQQPSHRRVRGTSPAGYRPDHDAASVTP